jgi:hypothetical protein
MFWLFSDASNIIQNKCMKPLTTEASFFVQYWVLDVHDIDFIMHCPLLSGFMETRQWFIFELRQCRNGITYENYIEWDCSIVLYSYNLYFFSPFIRVILTYLIAKKFNYTRCMKYDWINLWSLYTAKGRILIIVLNLTMEYWWCC